MAIDFSRNSHGYDEDDPEAIECKTREVAARVRYAQQEVKKMIAEAQARAKKAHVDEQVARMHADALLAQAQDMHKRAMQAQSDAQAVENTADAEMLRAAMATIKTAENAAENESPDFSL